MDISALSAKLGEILTPYMDLGALFMIFLVFTLIGLIIGLGILNAIRNGLMVAVGFNGVYIVVDFFVSAITPAATSVFALEPPPSPLTRTWVVAVASGKGYFPCISFTKYFRNGIRNRMPSTPPSSELSTIWKKFTSMPRM